MAFKTRQGIEAQRLMLSGTSTPASGEPLWTTDYKQYYVGDGTTPGGIFIGPGINTGTSVLFDNITCTTLTTTGSSVHTTTLHAQAVSATSIHATGVTASTLLLSSSATTKILYCTGVRAQGDLSGYTLYLTGDTTGRSAYYSLDVKSVNGGFSGTHIIALTGTIGLLTATTITAQTFSGISSPMISGSSSSTPAYFGWAGNSVFGFGNHLTLSNVFSTGANPSIFFNVTGDTKWGIDCDKTNSNLRFYAGSDHSGDTYFTYGDIYVTAMLSAGSLYATSIYSGGVDIATLWGTGGSGGTGVTVHSGLTGLLNNDHPQYRLTANTIPASSITSGTFAGSGVDFTFPRYVYANTVVLSGDNIYINNGNKNSAGGIYVPAAPNTDGNFYYVTATTSWQTSNKVNLLNTLVATTITGTNFVSGTTNLSSIFASSSHTHNYSALTSTAHTHSATAITSGTFDVGTFVFPGDVYASSFTAGTMRTGTDLIVGNELFINYAGGLPSRFWMHDGTTFSGANISFNSGQFEISHPCNIGGNYVATDGNGSGYDLYLNTNTSNTARVWFGHAGGAYNAHNLSYDTTLNTFAFNTGLTVNGTLKATGTTTLATTHVTTLTATTLVLSSSANTKILYCTGVRAEGDITGYSLTTTGDVTSRAAYFTNDVKSQFGGFSGTHVIALTGTVGSLTSTTITAQTFSGITPPMISGASNPAFPLYFGWSGNSAFGFGNHLTLSNTLATSENPSIFFNVTGGTKWGLECDRTNNNLRLYAGAAHGGDILLTYGDVFVTASLSAATYSGITLTKSITVPTPIATENIAMFYTDRLLTHLGVYTVVSGSSTPSVTWEIRNGTGRTDAGTLIHSGVTTATTLPYTGSAISSSVVSANTWVWLKTTATGGTTNEFHLTMKYKEV